MPSSSRRQQEHLFDESNHDTFRSLFMMSAICILAYVIFFSGKSSAIPKRPSKAWRRLCRMWQRLVWHFFPPPIRPKRGGRNKKYHRTVKVFHIDFLNMGKQTRAHFEICELPPGEPTFRSESSKYWDIDDEYLVRSSNHWSNDGRKVKSNWWTIEDWAYQARKAPPNDWLTGKCAYRDFDRQFTDFDNFYRHSRAHFLPVERPERRPDYTSYSGSIYWDEGDHVIRASDHWSNQCGPIKDCWWTFDAESYAALKPDKETVISGMCKYSDFERLGRWFGKQINDRKLANYVKRDRSEAVKTW